MLVPGFGSARVPVQVRLFLSLGVSVAIFAVLGEFEGVRQNANDLTLMAKLAGVETAKGLFIGFLVRFFFASLQFMAEGVASALGIGLNEASVPRMRAIARAGVLVSITATALFFITDQHLELLRALVQSYIVFRFGAEFGNEWRDGGAGKVLTAASFLALQVCSPFLIFVNRC